MSDEQVRIRKFQPADLPVLKVLTTDAFEPVSIDRNMERLFGVINGQDWRWRKARHIDEDVERDVSGVFVAEVEEKVVGYITTWMDASAGLGFIPNLAVDAEQRGKGIGRSLIQHALGHFREHGLSHARIETLDQNEIGQALYPSLGFREVARQIHYCMALDDSAAKPT